MAHTGSHAVISCIAAADDDDVFVLCADKAAFCQTVVKQCFCSGFQEINCKTDAEADRLASRMVGVPCMVIRNGGNAIPLSMLKKGDIISLFNGSTYFHTMFYEGKGKYADSTCGRSDEIQSGQTMSEGTKAQVKVAVRYVG